MTSAPTQGDGLPGGEGAVALRPGGGSASRAALLQARPTQRGCFSAVTDG